MTPFTHELVWIGIIGALFLLLFATGEVLRRFAKVCGEFTRKFVHLGGCFIALTFPFVFESVWSVFVLGGAFSLIIFVSGKHHALQSVHDVDRRTRGGIYHPLAICLCFWLSVVLEEKLLYIIAIMVLALADSMAAMIGKVYGRKCYDVEKGNRKSVEGSIIFFLVTFLTVHLLLLLLSYMGRTETVLVALLIAILVTLFEAISLDGADNLFIPLGTLFILAKNMMPDSNAIAFQLFALAISAIVLFFIVHPFRKIGPSGYIALTLAAYTGWGLVDIFWMLPFLLGALLVCRTDRVITAPAEADGVYRVRPTFFLVLVPVIWVLTANLTGKLYGEEFHKLFYSSFIASLITQLEISKLNSSDRPARVVSTTLLFALPFVPFFFAVFPLNAAVLAIQLVLTLACCLLTIGIWRVVKLENNRFWLRMAIALIGSALPALYQLLTLLYGGKS